MPSPSFPSEAIPPVPSKSVPSSTTTTGRGGSLPRGRRQRPAATAAAHSLALTVLGHGGQAQEVAITSLKRGGVARVAVLAHARHLSLSALGSAVPVSSSEDAEHTARELAWQLSGTRPGVERAIVDIELRYGLDTVSFARALGLPAQRALNQSRRIEAVWAETLDPALLASLGSAGCPDLEDILVGGGLLPSQAVADPPTGEVRLDGANVVENPHNAHSPVPLSILLELAPSVLQHSSSCDACGMRLRSMTSVRALNGQRSVPEVPEEVARVAPLSRRRIGAPPPPSIERQRFSGMAWKRFGAFAAIAGATVVLLFFIANLVTDRTSQSDRVERLVVEPSPSELNVSNDRMSTAEPEAQLRNDSTEDMLWNATTSASWLRITPSDGRLRPGALETIRAETDARPPNSESEASITITYGDGRSKVIRYSSL